MADFMALSRSRVESCCFTAIQRLRSLVPGYGRKITLEVAHGRAKTYSEQVIAYYRRRCVSHCTTNLFKLNNVITTMVIMSLDDRTYCVRSAFTHLRFCRKLYDCSWHYFRARNYCVIYWHCCRPPTIWLPFEKETFRPPVWGVRGTWWSGICVICPFDSPPVGSY